MNMDDRLRQLYEVFLQSNGVCTDTRQLQPDQLFFALKGPNFNGNAYAKGALEAGARMAVIDEAEYDKGEDYFLVDDVLKTFQQLANHHRKQFDIPFIGITGSNGKTTTKELLARVLAPKYKVHFTQGNLNNHIGVPLTLLSMPKDTEIAIIEMGANHLGDIAELCAMAEPDYGLITNIGNAHIGEFGGKENIIRGKSELFDHLRKTEGTPFINVDDKVLRNMSKRFANAIQYPNEQAVFIESNPFVNYKDAAGVTHQTKLVGDYNFINLAAALSVGKAFGVENGYDEIDQYAPDNNRSQLLEIGSNKIILDAYNANPDSMIAALQNLEKMPQTTKIAMLGDMKELGEYSAGEHEKVLKFGRNSGIQHVYGVGEDFCAVGEESCFNTVDDLVDHLKKEPIQNAAVLIKGSRSMQMERLIKINEIWI